MILTLTLNPAVDKTVRVAALLPGAVHRVGESQLDPAGKGINVSRMVERLGWPTLAFGVLAGEIGRLVDSALAEEGVHAHFVWVPGQTRLNVTIFDESTDEGTSFYEPGPAVDAPTLGALRGALRPWLLVSRALVLAGSLPPGAPEDVYADLIAEARSLGVPTILDAEGQALACGLAAGPDLVKPNREEAEALLGRKLTDLPAVIAGGREIIARGARAAVVSLGAAGAVAVADGGAWLAVPPPVQRQSTVGSGDSLVAGLAVSLARGEGLVEGLRLGTAAGAATAMSPGTALGTPEDVAALLPKVRVAPI